MSGIFAAAKCPACGADVDSGAGRCGRCGTSLSLSACPHCGATAGISKNAEFRFVCDVCGGPRIPSPLGKRSGKEGAGLSKANQARKGRATGRAAVVGAGVGFSFLSLLFVLFWLLFGLGLFSGLAYGALSIPFLALFAWGSTKAKREGQAIGPALDEAWLAAAAELLAKSKGQMSATDVAAALSIEEEKAEELLALIDVDRSVGRRFASSDAMAAFDAKLQQSSQKSAEAAGRAEHEAQAEQEAQEALAEERKTSAQQK